MRVLVFGGLLILAGCGGGSTTGTNYSEPPPMAEIVATPIPKASDVPAEGAVANIADAPEEMVTNSDAIAGGNAM